MVNQRGRNAHIGGGGYTDYINFHVSNYTWIECIGSNSNIVLDPGVTEYDIKRIGDGIDFC